MSILSFVSAFELGFIYAVMALGVFLSFRTLNTPDLTVDGSFVTGAAVSTVMCVAGINPIIALLGALISGGLAGVVTAVLNTKLKIEALLSGILVMLGLYSINMRIMGGKANISFLNNDTIYEMAKYIFPEKLSAMVLGIIILIIIVVLFLLFLKTRVGLALRATGDNEDMVKSCGVDSSMMRIIGLGLSNAFVGLSGGMLSQYQTSIDIGMGVGMVVIGLASVIIGETIFGTKTLPRRLIAVVLGAVLYRLIISFAIEWGMEAMDLKLVSAVIVALALSFGMLGDKFSFRKKRKKGIKKDA